MVVTLLTLDLLLPASRTLKDKRQVLRSIIDRTRARLNVSIAEVDHQDDHRRAVLAVACVGSSMTVVRGTLDSVVRICEAQGEVEIIAQTCEAL